MYKNILCLVFVFLLISKPLFSQQIDKNSSDADTNFRTATLLFDSTKYDSAALFYSSAAVIYKKNSRWRKFLHSKTQESTCFRLNYQLDNAVSTIENAIDVALQHINKQDTVLRNAYRTYGLASYENSQYTNALQGFFTALKMHQSTTKEDDMLISEYYNDIGKVYYYKSVLDSAIWYFQRSLEIREKILGENHIKVADMYNNLGVVYDQNSQFDKAREYYLISLKIKKNVLPQTHPKIADTYLNLGQLFRTLEKYQTALEYKQNALDIYLTNYGETDINTAKTYKEIGVTYKNLNQYDTALVCLSKALHIFTKIFKQKHPYIFNTQTSIAILYEEIGEYNKALEIKKEVLHNRIELFGEQHWTVILSYNNLGIACRVKGDYNAALKNYQKSIELTSAMFGDSSRYLIPFYENISAIHLKLNHNNLALQYIRKGLDLNNKISPDKKVTTADFYLKTGFVYQNFQQYSKALLYYNRALQISLNELGNKHKQISIIYFHIAQNLLKLNEYDSALIYLQKSLRIEKDIYGEKHPDISLSYKALGVMYHQMQQYDTAKQYLLKSLFMAKNYFADKHPVVADNYNKLGDVSLSANKPDEALLFYQKALYSNIRGFTDSLQIAALPETITKHFDWEHLLHTLKQKAAILADTNYILPKYLREKRYNLVLKHYQKADSLIQITRSAIINTNDKLILAKKAAEVYTQAVAFCFKNANEEMAFYFSEQNKNAVLLDALAAVNARHFANIPDSLLEKEYDLNVDIAFYKKQLNENPDSTRKVILRNQLFECNRRRDSLLLAFENQYPEYYELKHGRKNTSVEELQKALDKKTAMISYMTGDSVVYIFTLTKKNLQIMAVNKSPDFTTKAKLLHKAMSIPVTEIYKKVYTDLAFAFYNRYFPDNLDRSIKNLIIIPDDVFNKLPYEAWLTDSVQAQQNYHEMPFLINKYCISYTYSANLFYRLFGSNQQQSQKQAPPYDWLAIAPIFTKETTSQTVLKTRKMLLATDSLNEVQQSRALLTNNQFIIPLPNTEKEVTTIFNAFEEKNRKATILLHEKANEAFVKSGELSKYRMLHFATHGFVNETKPEFSGILLAQNDSSKEDGVLHTAEIYNLHLNSHLTVLSACETALGKFERGEGTIGLSRAMLYAGSQNLLLSLWKVSDTATSELMIDFYNNILHSRDTENYAKKLWQAKQKLISGQKYAAPRFWSPFILVGK